MVDVAIYSARSKGYLEEVDRVPDIETIDEARTILLELFECYSDNPEWNVKHATINDSLTEGHVFGFCRDEHHMLTLEDPGQQTTQEAWNAKITARLEMG